jgi:hypothetical protein
MAEAARHADTLRRTDDRYRLVLVVIAAVYVAIGLIVALPPLQKPATNPRLGLLVVLGGGLVVCVFWLLRMRAASRWGSARFSWSIAAFSVWNGAVVAVSATTGWWGPGQSALHFTASAVVAAVPLVVAAALMGSNRR